MISVAIIGQGLWGHKLTQSLNKHRADFQVDLLSAREVLSEPPSKKYDVIWIASRPNEQVRVLELSVSKSKLIILEKPICEKIEDFARVEKILALGELSLGLSRPWCFSSAWLNATEILKSWEWGGSSVKFRRKGPASHTYITPVEDWIPHDIYLASDLFPTFEDDFAVRYLRSNPNEFELSLYSRNETTVNFSFLENTSKESTIEVDSPSGELFVNLSENVILLNGERIEVASPNNYDSICRNLYAAINGENKRTRQLVRTQKWIKTLIEQAK